ncbi:methyltransferase domain-containing protein [Ktedonosporobacter rubrisoli]|uniref:Methyltransferase domain-containing protein n=1 Tax=Ktedonosporobacter rubrisoli TaxID=2509675 RepID=A0A4P6K302_KTERU|nr:methyltransferase domain-containing protein [Ktedonosporobacter rubrisoli]QBD82617.1 methyltransferase domain-containing protein [Ktedonosporobacter rubrisoli]
MSTPLFDSTRYKENQRQGWNNVALGWRSWWESFERAAQEVSDHLITVAHILSGQRVLDIATGIGEPAVTAAHRVGLTGEVMALDFAPEMVAIAKERAGAHGLENITFVISDAEQLDLPQGYFDAILCRWGLMFLPNLVTALDGMRQHLKMGGRLAAAVWSRADKAPVASLALAVVGRHIQAPPQASSSPGPFSLADVSALTHAFELAGFIDVRSELMTPVWEFATAEDYTRFQRDIAPPIKAMIAHLSPDHQLQIWQEITEAARHYQTSDGRIQIPGELICVVGQRSTGE